MTDITDTQARSGYNSNQVVAMFENYAQATSGPRGPGGCQRTAFAHRDCLTNRAPPPIPASPMSGTRKAFGAQ